MEYALTTRQGKAIPGTYLRLWLHLTWNSVPLPLSALGDENSVAVKAVASSRTENEDQRKTTPLTHRTNLVLRRAPEEMTPSTSRKTVRQHEHEKVPVATRKSRDSNTTTTTTTSTSSCRHRHHGRQRHQQQQQQQRQKTIEKENQAFQARLQKTTSCISTSLPLHAKQVAKRMAQSVKSQRQKNQAKIQAENNKAAATLRKHAIQQQRRSGNHDTQHALWTTTPPQQQQQQQQQKVYTDQIELVALVAKLQEEIATTREAVFTAKANLSRRITCNGKDAHVLEALQRALARTTPHGEANTQKINHVHATNAKKITRPRSSVPWTTGTIRTTNEHLDQEKDMAAQHSTMLALLEREEEGIERERQRYDTQDFGSHQSIHLSIYLSLSIYIDI
jgi:hypothetical protein